MTAKSFKGHIQFDDRKITFEGPRKFVEEMVAKYSRSSNPQAKPENQEYLLERSIVPAGGSERNLIAAKRPRGHHEIVAVLAFALTESGTRDFTEDDIRRAYIRAGVRPPKVVAQALRDAKNKYEFLEVSGERGRYRLTNHGDRVVRFDLPRQRSES
jgi:hypothetical protein